MDSLQQQLEAVSDKTAQCIDAEQEIEHHDFKRFADLMCCRTSLDSGKDVFPMLQMCVDQLCPLLQQLGSDLITQCPATYVCNNPQVRRSSSRRECTSRS